MRRAAPFALLLAAFLALESASFPMLAAVHSGDETVWGRVARASVFSADFYTSIRPFTVPLVHKLLGGHEPSVVWFQSFFSVLCWFTLALALARHFLGRSAQIAAASLVCLFSLTVPVNQWDLVIRSESIFFSLFALTLALSLEGARRLREGEPLPAALIAGWALVCLLFASARDSGLYVLALLAAGFALWLGLYALARRREGTPGLHRRGAVALLALLSVMGAVQVSTASSPRWRTPLISVVLGRVLPDADVHRKWIDLYGFPRNAVFERYAGLEPWSPTPEGPEVRRRLERAPELAEVETWLRQRGMASYQRWLLFDAPLRSLTAAFAALSRHANHFAPGYAKGAGQTAWTVPLSTLLHPRLPAPLLCWLAVLFSGAACAWTSPAARLLGLAAVFLAVNAFSQAFIGYHVASVEVPRHMLPSMVMLRLAALTGLLAWLCAIAAAIRTSAQSTTERSPEGRSIPSPGSAQAASRGSS